MWKSKTASASMPELGPPEPEDPEAGGQYRVPGISKENAKFLIST
jgi:hypothetical protein